MPLAAIACLSLAAKLEEVGMPADIHALQVASPRLTYISAVVSSLPICFSLPEYAIGTTRVAHLHVHALLN